MGMNIVNSNKKYAQIATLSEYFDLSEDYFKRRMRYKHEKNDNSKPFVEGEFFFVPERTSLTKKAIIWEIAVVEKYLRGEGYELESKDDVEVQKLLRRTAFFRYDFTIPNWLLRIFKKIFRSK